MASLVQCKPCKILRKNHTHKTAQIYTYFVFNLISSYFQNNKCRLSKYTTDVQHLLCILTGTRQPELFEIPLARSVVAVGYIMNNDEMLKEQATQSQNNISK